MAFNPPCWLASGKYQTMAAYTLPGIYKLPPFTTEQILTRDNEGLVVHIHTPKNPKRCVVLLHGFTGNADSKYLRRLTPLLFEAGFQVIRVNLRGAGQSTKTCTKLYHAGRYEDIFDILHHLERKNDLPITLVGFSLGGNVSLRVAARADEHCNHLDSIISVSAPLELRECTALLNQPQNKVFSDHFVKYVKSEIKTIAEYHPHIQYPDVSNVQTVYEFDNVFTGPVNGFADADDYYYQCSAYYELEAINTPTFIMHGLDDPFICPKSYRNLPDNPLIKHCITDHGGHLGWLQSPLKGQVRWMDSTLLKQIEYFHHHKDFYVIN